MQLVVDSLMTNYRRYGQGNKKLVLVLHGWGDSVQGWTEFARSLSDAYEVVCVDLPGFGGTQRPAEPWGLDEYASFVSHFLDKSGIKPYAIIGHSNGGAIAVRGLARDALTAERLVLLSSAGVRSEYKGRKKALRLLAKTGKILATPLPEAVKRRLRRKMYTTVGSDMLVVESLQETFKRVVSDDIQQDAGRLRLPVLLIYGRNDVSTPPDFGRLLHSTIKGSTFVLLDDAEHFVHQDQSDEVQRLVREFL